MFTRTTTLKMTPCPRCGKPLDAATCISSHDTPDPGDISICMYCAQLLEYDKGLMLIPLTPAKLDQVEREAPHIYRLVTDAVSAVISMMKG